MVCVGTFAITVELSAQAIAAIIDLGAACERGFEPGNAFNHPVWENFGHGGRGGLHRVAPLNYIANLFSIIILK